MARSLHRLLFTETQAVFFHFLHLSCMVDQQTNFPFMCKKVDPLHSLFNLVSLAFKDVLRVIKPKGTSSDSRSCRSKPLAWRHFLICIEISRLITQERVNACPPSPPSLEPPPFAPWLQAMPRASTLVPLPAVAIWSSGVTNVRNFFEASLSLGI